MNGIKTFIFKLIPIMLLICFVAFGISAIFNIANITYLNSQTIDGNTIYSFNTQAYLQNIQPTYIKDALDDIIDTGTLNTVVRSWQVLWADGYQAGDITKSIVNGFTLTIDGVLIILSIPIVMVRIVAGAVLSILCILGINVNAPNTIICSSLLRLNVWDTIPLITAWL